MHEYQFDLIVIGGGPGGYVAAIRAAQRGLSVALVEKKFLGGTCLNIGCIPTKALIHAGELYREAQNFGSIGLYTESLSFDFPHIHEYKRDIVHRMRDGVEALLKLNQVTVYNKVGTIIDANTVILDGEEQIKGNFLLIATGSEPSLPPFRGLDTIIDNDNVMTSDDLLYKEDELLESLIILGANVISLEFATWYNALGSEVTIILRKDRIFPALDKELAQKLTMILKKRGVTIITGSTVENITEENGITVSYKKKSGEEDSVSAAGLLLATGRKPYLDGLFADGFAVQMEHDSIVIDERFRTSVSNIYAIGDVTGKAQLAHFASAMGIAAVEEMIGAESSIDFNVVPECLYTHPEIACVGLTADEAREQGIEVRIGKYLMGANGKSLIEQDESGFIKVVCDAETRVILGAQLMCLRATDMIGELAVAIANKLTVEQLSTVIHPHPSFCEGIFEAIEDVDSMAIHSMRIQRK